MMGKHRTDRTDPLGSDRFEDFRDRRTHDRPNLISGRHDVDDSCGTGIGLQENGMFQHRGMNRGPAEGWWKGKKTADQKKLFTK